MYFFPDLNAIRLEVIPNRMTKVPLTYQNAWVHTRHASQPSLFLCSDFIKKLCKKTTLTISVFFPFFSLLILYGDEKSGKVLQFVKQNSKALSKRLMILICIYGVRTTQPP